MERNIPAEFFQKVYAGKICQTFFCSAVIYQHSCHFWTDPKIDNTVATTRLAPLTLILKLYFWSFTVISCHFFARKFKFWMFPINFILETVPIDVI